MLRSDPRIHYKMYKAKKNMVYAALFSFAVLGGLGLSQNAKADTVENNNVTPTAQTTVNSAQSTTGATPQSMPTQSAVPTQSPAASLKTSNSAPTAQPVSAQPVVNSQANSAFNAGNQIQTTALNVQSGQPAQRFAVASRARLYARSLAQTSQGVSNVQGTLTNANGSDDSTISIRPGQDQSMLRSFSLKLDFDVDASQIKANQSYQIGQVSTTYDNNGYFVPVWNNDYSVPFSINNQKYGSIQLASFDSLKSQTISVHFDRDADSNMTGLQHISVNMPGIIVTGYNMSPLIIPSGQDSVLNDKLQLINNQHQVISEKTLNIYKALINYATDPLYENGDGFGATGASHSNLIHNFTPTVDGDGDLNKLANGEQVNVRQMPDIIEVGGRIAAEGNEILPQHTFVYKDVYIPVYHSDGKRSNDFIDAGPWRSTSEQSKYPAVNLGDGLTLDQMKQASYTGFGYSLQTDHSYLYLIKVPSKDMQADEDTLKKAVREHSWQLAADSDPDKALQITFDKFDQGLKLYEFQTDVPIADPTVPAKLTITRLYSNYLSNPNQNSTVSTTTYPISSMAHGQAAVKLHVINATNGTELNQVQNFVDWPNQGKKANLSLPSIKGYQVVSDASAASAALQKLGLKGNVVTQAEAVDYPAADNTTNYYIVMDPVTETATVHFIDQDSGNKELSHVDLTGAYNTPVTANGQVNNMLNNYVNNQGYELVSNDLTGNHLYTDVHQDFNIVLKHKTQKRNPDNDPSDATKDITRTINVHNPDGSVKTTKQTAHLTREGVQDAVTSQTNWGAWSTGNWAEFDTPAIQDYTPSQAKVNAQTVDSNTQDQTIDITYKANILNKDVDFVVPEVIHRTDQHGQTTIDRNQNVTLHGTVTYNAATSQLVGFDLHSADFPAYDIPQIDGYTSHVQEDHIVSLIPGDTNFDKDAFLKDPSGYFNQIMKGRQGGLDHVIDAKTVPQTTAMQYKDGSVDRSYDFYITYTADPQSAQVIYYDTILKKNVKADTLNGKTDETVNTNIQVPANYVLVPGQNLPATYTFKGSNNQNIIVNLTHATKDTTTTDPGAHKTVTRTIIVNTPHDGTKTTKQDAQLTRSATLDLVTNTTTYGNWNTGTWAKYDTPAVPGYTPTQGSVPQVTVNGDTQNTTVTVNYTANPHVQVIEYVGDGKVQHTQNVNGVTDQTVNGIQPEVPTNWVLAPGAKVPASVTFGPNDPQPIIVNIVHDTKDVTKSDAGAHKTITRTIHVNDPHKGTSTTNQVVNLTRPAWFDMVTNDIHYGEWNTGDWTEFDSPVVAGYTVNPATVAAQTVTSDTKDTIVNVNYTANPQQVVLNFVDKTGKVIATHLYKGVTDGTAKIDAQVPTNWVLVPGQTIPTSYTFKPSDNKDINIVIEHGTKDTSKTDKNAVRDVTRVINLHDPYKGTTTTKQVAHLHRSATLDLVTNQTTYGKWDTDATNWKEFDVPAVDGYTPNMNKVAAATVDENTKDQTIDVTYTANPQQVILNFVDKAGNVIASHTYNGVTDGTAKIDAQVPENWVLVKGQTIPTDYTFKAEGNKDIDILIEHGTQDVSKTDEKANKDITRTIIVTNPDGKKTTTNQVAHLNRSAIKDLVTGEVTYGQWNTGKWDAFDTPEIAGYDASIHHLDGQNVDINDEDETINIHYNALTHTQDINYVDDNGNVVGTQVVTGQTGETTGFTPDVPNGYTIVPGQDIPKSFTFGANDPKTLVIHVTKPSNNSQTPASDQPASNEPASQTPAQSESGSNAAPASDNSVAPSAPASANTNAGTETSYAVPATAAPVATATPIAQTSGNSNADQGTLPQTGDNSISAIAGLSLAGMTGAILAAGALKRRHN